MRLDAEFFRLPLRFDVERLSEEVGQFPESAWIAHPDGMPGNSAIPLISLNGEDNNSFQGRMLPTPHLAKCPYIEQIIASFDEVFGRSRLMRLAGGCEVVQHNDSNYHWYTRVRVHIPVITYPEVVFYCGNKHVHMGAGECWIFDAWQQHRVVNGTDKTRVHLVIDTAGSAKFWEMVARSERPCDPLGSPPVEPRFIAYEPNKRVQIKTEKFNATPVLAPGELDGLVGDLIRDFRAEPSNDARLAAEYTRLMRGFAKDWRALWNLYGYDEAGVERYKQLMVSVGQAIKALPGDLKLSSNGLPARSAFFYLVFDAALCPVVRPNFAPAAAATAPAAGGEPVPAVGRNDPCPCGSGRRYKHCHGSLSAAAG